MCVCVYEACTHAEVFLLTKTMTHKDGTSDSGRPDVRVGVFKVWVSLRAARLTGERRLN